MLSLKSALLVYLRRDIVKPGPKTQIPKAQPQPSQTQIPISFKGTGADTKPTGLV